MAKYSDRKKIEAARDYCSGRLGLRQVAQRHSVNVASLRLWAAAYRLHGARGVLTKERRFYSADFKAVGIATHAQREALLSAGGGLVQRPETRHDRVAPQHFSPGALELQAAKMG
jgi:Transposase